MPLETETLPTDPSEPMRNAPPDIQDLMKRVLIIEKQKIHLARPHVNDDIVRAIKEIVK
jgi:hypothetical protein